MQRNLRRTLITLLFAAVTVVSANAQTIGAEDDTWITGSGTQVDFSNFGKISISQLLGSQPVNSIVSFTGVPLSSSLGSADTLVARGSVTIADRFSTTLSIKRAFAQLQSGHDAAGRARRITWPCRWPRRAIPARSISRRPALKAGPSPPALP